VKLIAEYNWGPDRVESIRFSIPVKTVDMPPIDIVVPAPLRPWDDFVRKALDVLKRQKQIGIVLSNDQTRRLECLLRGILDPKFDDRFVNYWDLWAHQRLISKDDPKWNLIINHARERLKLARRPTSDDRFILSSLEHMDLSIVKATKWLNMQYHNLGDAMSAGMVVIKDWIVKQQQSPNNLYSCYRP